MEPSSSPKSKSISRTQTSDPATHPPSQQILVTTSGFPSGSISTTILSQSSSASSPNYLVSAPPSNLHPHDNQQVQPQRHYHQEQQYSQVHSKPHQHDQHRVRSDSHDSHAQAQAQDKLQPQYATYPPQSHVQAHRPQKPFQEACAGEGGQLVQAWGTYGCSASRAHAFVQDPRNLPGIVPGTAMVPARCRRQQMQATLDAFDDAMARAGAAGGVGAQVDENAYGRERAYGEKMGRNVELLLAAGACEPGMSTSGS
ncbi:hypothetical protein MKZ38_002593 [Zalerion maritima]|uniref:Uncharacterized protein n=1 Tax=Zalerion maritima TaxID=339359 RepID=A0AAD5RPI0_9PEZI|nr:hypothetical protein MKZ38_002593 [Zalerion maritima]